MCARCFLSKQPETLPSKRHPLMTTSLAAAISETALPACDLMKFANILIRALARLSSKRGER
jgi:hypothetical protein